MDRWRQRVRELGGDPEAVLAAQEAPKSPD